MSEVPELLMKVWGGLDWTRPIVFIVPIMSFLCSVMAAATGVGGAKTWLVGWQIAWYVFGIKEAEGLTLVVELMSVSALVNVIQFAYHEWRVWFHLGKLGLAYALCMAIMSPVGAHLRATCEPHSVKTVVAWIMIAYVAWKAPVPQWHILTGNLPGVETTDERTLHLQPRGAELDQKAEVVKAEAAKLVEKRAREEAMQWDIQGHWLQLCMSGIFSGFLGGLCGMVGTPLMVFVSQYNVPKFLARPLLPLGMLFELPVRFFFLFYYAGVDCILADLHLWAITLAFAQVGFYVGDILARKMSQQTFLYVLFGLCVVSASSTLGIVHLKPASFAALAALATAFACRSFWSAKTAENDSDSSSESDSTSTMEASTVQAPAIERE